MAGLLLASERASMGGEVQPHWVLRIVASFPERRAGLVVRGFSPTGCCAWRASFWRASGRVWEGRFSPTGCCASWRPFLRGVRGWWYGGLAPLGAAHGGPPSGERAGEYGRRGSAPLGAAHRGVLS